MKKNLKCALYSKPSIKCTIRLESEVVSTQRLGEKKISHLLIVLLCDTKQSVWLSFSLAYPNKADVSVLLFQSSKVRPWPHVKSSSAWAPRVGQLCKAPADSVLMRLKEAKCWLNSFSTKLIRFHKTLFETLKDNPPELAYTASKRSPCFAWALHMFWYSSR